MYSKFLIPLAAMVAPFGAAGALQAQHMNAADAPCKAAGAGVDQADCLTLAARRTDADLNGVYQRIIAILASGDRQKLQGAERIWLTYRDETCAAERSLYAGGTGGLAAYPACLESLTRQRIADLKTTYWWKVEKSGG